MVIPEDKLPITDELISRLGGTIKVNWHDLDEDVKHYYTRYMILLDNDLRKDFGLQNMTETEWFYNAYYWVLAFAKRYKSIYGFDAGVEQETFKVLEAAPADVDWKTVESTNQLV